MSTGPSPLALERRVMFDGAAAVDAATRAIAEPAAADAGAAPADDAPALAATPAEKAQRLLDLHVDAADPLLSLLQAGEQLAGSLLAQFATDDGYLATMRALFGPAADDAEFDTRATALRDRLIAGDLGLRTELRGGLDMIGARAAFAAVTPDGPTLFINRDWIDGASAADVATLMLEEIGHALDRMLNGASDTRGDEGELFAATVTGQSLSDDDRARIAAEDDHGYLSLNGLPVEVEMATATFNAVYRATLSYDPSGFFGEETSRIDLNTAKLNLAGSQVVFSQAGTQFSGNNVLGTITYTDTGGVSRSITSALASRPIKTGSTIEGFYVWIDVDGDTRDSAADIAYVLSRNNTYFETTMNGTNIQSSSDRVDNALNTVADPAVVARDVTVNEASSYVVFSATANAGDTITLTTGGGTATKTTDYGSIIEYSTDSGANWTTYTGSFTLSGSGNFLVRSTVVQDTSFERSETFTLTVSNGTTSATGTATIKDDGTGTIFNADGSADTTTAKDDDRSLSVNTITVNEGSPYAVFEVTVNAGETLTLGLTAGTATGGGTDYGSGTATNLQYYNGSSWTNYTGAITLTSGMLTGGKLLVRTPVVNDMTFEGAESFTLNAAYTSGLSRSTTGTATIKDDGTGSYFPNNTTGTADATATLNDDRALSVNTISVNEASPFAVFQVTVEAGQTLTLTLTDGTATGAGTDFGSGGADNLQYYDGTAWTNYTGPITLTSAMLSGGKLLVRTAINNDVTPEGSEQFTLTAAYTSGASRSATGTATIRDDGQGSYYPDNTTGATDATAILNDDRPVAADDITVNEASPYAVFTARAAATDNVTLTLTSGTATSGTDFGTALEYSLDNGLTWTPYTAPFVPGGTGSFLVRAPVMADTLPEGAETFTLTVSNGTASSVATATIRDDGTGTIFNDDGTANTTATKDDDRSLAVSSPTINEASPYGVFQVTANAGQTLTLALAAGTATGGGTDFGAAGATNLQYYDGTAWVNYTGAITLTSGMLTSGALLVRTPVINDASFERSETLTLTAAYTSGASRSATGNGAIVDDGTGTIYNDDGTANTTATKDDDRSLAVNSPTVNEGSPYGVFQVTANAGETLTLALAAGTATGAGTDFGASGATNLQYYDGTSWVNYTGAITLTSGMLSSGALLVRTPVVNDGTYEGSETLTLTAAYTSGASRSATGTGAIVDDGTGTIFNADGTVDTTTAKNDDRALSVSSPTINEGSPYGVFQVTANAGQTLTLALAAGTATGTGTDFGASGATNLQYYDGTAWLNYTGAITLTSGMLTSGALLVRTPVINDATFEGSETLTLTAAYTSGASRSATGNGAIVDDGTGTIYNADGTVNTTAAKDNDAPTLSVADIELNEASPYAVFTVRLSAASTQAITFLPTVGSLEATAGTDTGSTLQYYDGTQWRNVPAGGVTLAAGATEVKLRVAVVNDTLFEGAERFRLNLAVTSGSTASASVTATATVYDDGRGRVYDADGNVTAAPPDDDTPRPPRPVLIVSGQGIVPPPVAETPALPPQQPFIPTDVNARPIPPAVDLGSLTVANRIPDQFSERNGDAKFAVPEGTFVHSNPGERLSLGAAMADGTPLPTWLSFNGTTGTFEGRPPTNFTGTLQIKVIARDASGNEVEAIFRYSVGDQSAAQTAPQAAPAEAQPVPGVQGAVEPEDDASVAQAEDAPPKARVGLQQQLREQLARSRADAVPARPALPAARAV